MIRWLSSQKGPFWVWLVFSVSWCIAIISDPPDGKAQLKLYAEWQGTPLPDWDAERYLGVSLAALLPPILIAGIWKSLKWFSAKLAGEQEESGK
jgi:hypothetical protein